MKDAIEKLEKQIEKDYIIGMGLVNYGDTARAVRLSKNIEGLYYAISILKDENKNES